ncbi:MAG TPA: biotin--[acetyl-CoA-carboxylase] ligase [Roseomonas sp.]|jgi:BirA family biotin operon repressor/biotin-[acetyl-CoA-carboxylase] ligase
MTAPGFRLEIHESLASTSDLVLQRAQAGEPEGLAILARRQTAGRGTSGRQWQSLAGNLFLSLLLRPPGSIRDAPQWALLTAVALAETLAPLLHDPAGLRLKWPNDLLLDGAKLAGILAEAAADGQGGIAWLVLGIGVNLAHAPALPDRPTASLPPPAPAPEDVAAALLQAIARWRDIHAQAGLAPVRQAWCARGPEPGAPLSVRQGDNGLLTGRFAGLGEDGSLLLETGTGLRRVVSGEIS